MCVATLWANWTKSPVLSAQNAELVDGIRSHSRVILCKWNWSVEHLMLALNGYRALLDRLFILADMEKLASHRLREGVQSKADAQQLLRCREELHLIHQEKLKLFADLQSLVLTTSTTALAAASH